MNSTAAAAVCGLWRYTSVIRLCLFLKVAPQTTFHRAVKLWERKSPPDVVGGQIGVVRTESPQRPLPGRANQRVHIVAAADRYMNFAINNK